MQLTYTGDWKSDRPEAAVLDIGTYFASVHWNTGRDAWTWTVHWVDIAAEFDIESVQIAQGHVDSQELARTAAEAAIRQCHAVQ